MTTDTTEWIKLEKRLRDEASRAGCLGDNPISDLLIKAADALTTARAAEERVRRETIEGVDPGMRLMDTKREVFGDQKDWATSDDHYRFGWNACRAEILNRLEALLTNQQTPVAGEKA